MRIQKEKSQPVGIEIRASCNAGEGRRLTHSLRLIGRNDMAACTPPARQLLTMERVRGQGRSALEQACKRADKGGQKGLHAAPSAGLIANDSIQ
jgi:hypothetical protein